MKWTIAIALLSVSLLACLAVGLAWSETILVHDTLVTQAVFNADFTSVSTDDPTQTIDPGYNKDVAWTEVWLDDDDGNFRYETIHAVVHNAYPCYSTEITFTIHNGGTMPERIAALDASASEVLEFTYSDVLGYVLDPGEEVVATATVHVTQPALQGHTYYFEIELCVASFVHGSIGFWKNWDSHETYSQGEIEGWLADIDSSSSWLGPTTVSGMVELMSSKATGNADVTKFRRHYLAVRLDECAGILGSGDAHDVTGLDAGNYLGLADPSDATLSEIISAIESKHGTSPTESQYLLMKDICVALYNYDI